MDSNQLLPIKCTMITLKSYETLVKSMVKSIEISKISKFIYNCLKLVTPW